MYAVVGCSDCSALWVVQGRPETTGCPRCETRHRFEKLKQFVTTDDEAHARDVRASMLANRQGHGEVFADLESYDEMERRLDDAGPNGEEYLSAAGFDDETIDEVESAAEGTASGGSGSRQEILREALDELERPTEESIVEYASERGVPAEHVEENLPKLVRRGEVSENGGRYRLL